MATLVEMQAHLAAKAGVLKFRLGRMTRRLRRQIQSFPLIRGVQRTIQKYNGGPLGHRSVRGVQRVLKVIGVKKEVNHLARSTQRAIGGLFGKKKKKARQEITIPECEEIVGDDGVPFASAYVLPPVIMEAQAVEPDEVAPPSSETDFVEDDGEGEGEIVEGSFSWPEDCHRSIPEELLVNRLVRTVLTGELSIDNVNLLLDFSEHLLLDKEVPISRFTSNTRSGLDAQIQIVDDISVPTTVANFVEPYSQLPIALMLILQSGAGIETLEGFASYPGGSCGCVTVTIDVRGNEAVGQCTFVQVNNTAEENAESSANECTRPISFLVADFQVFDGLLIVSSCFPLA